MIILSKNLKLCTKRTFFKRLFSIWAFIFATSMSLVGQTSKYDVTMAILAPKLITADSDQLSELGKDLSAFNLELEREIPEIKHVLKNDKSLTTRESELLKKRLEYLKQKDPYSRIPIHLQRNLDFYLRRKLSNRLIFPSKTKTEKKSFEKIANKEKVRFLVHLPKIHFYKKNNENCIDVHLQFYDNFEKKIVYSTHLNGKVSLSPTIWKKCSSKSNLCKLDKAILQLSYKIDSLLDDKLLSSLPSETLHSKRVEKLETLAYSLVPNPEILQIIKSHRSDLPIDHFYQGVINENMTRFYAFFAFEDRSKNSRELQSVNGTSIRADSIDTLNTPEIFLYDVAGVKYGSKWYIDFIGGDKPYSSILKFEDLKKSYMVSSLLSLDYFRLNSLDHNPSFWEQNLFFTRKKYEFYEFTYFIESLNVENARSLRYYGAPRVVLNVATVRFKEEVRDLRSSMMDQYFRPSYERLKHDTLNNFVNYNLKTWNHKERGYEVVFPKNRNVLLNPVQVTEKDGIDYLRFFVYIPDTLQVFEWTYPWKMTIEGNNAFGPAIFKILRKLSNYSGEVYVLEDDDFWQQYVLKKQGGNYLYLTKLE